MFVRREKKNKFVSRGRAQHLAGGVDRTLRLEEVSLPFVTSQGVDFPDSILRKPPGASSM